MCAYVRGCVMSEKPVYDEEKFKELILYVAAKYECEDFFGATKLNKLLFYSDFLAYKTLGRPITGAEYVALEFGPAPKRLLPVQDELVKSGDIAIERRTLQRRIIALRDPDLSEFSASEIAVVDQVIEALKDADAKQVSELSHAFLGWKAARAEGQATGQMVAIPYATVFVSNKALDEFEVAHGLELAEKYNWAV